MEIHQTLFSATTNKNGKKRSGNETKPRDGHTRALAHTLTYVHMHTHTDVYQLPPQKESR